MNACKLVYLRMRINGPYTYALHTDTPTHADVCIDGVKGRTISLRKSQIPLFFSRMTARAFSNLHKIHLQQTKELCQKKKNKNKFIKIYRQSNFQNNFEYLAIHIFAHMLICL